MSIGIFSSSIGADEKYALAIAVKRLDEGMKWTFFLVIWCISLERIHSDESEKHPFAKWEPDILKFEAADKKNPPEPGGNLFVGSSSIRKWDTDKDFPDLKPINRGFGGSTMAEVEPGTSRRVPRARIRNARA